MTGSRRLASDQDREDQLRLDDHGSHRQSLAAINRDVAPAVSGERLALPATPIGHATAARPAGPSGQSR